MMLRLRLEMHCKVIVLFLKSQKYIDGGGGNGGQEIGLRESNVFTQSILNKQSVLSKALSFQNVNKVKTNYRNNSKKENFVSSNFFSNIDFVYFHKVNWKFS